MGRWLLETPVDLLEVDATHFVFWRMLSEPELELDNDEKLLRGKTVIFFGLFSLDETFKFLIGACGRLN